MHSLYKYYICKDGRLFHEKGNSPWRWGNNSHYIKVANQDSSRKPIYLLEQAIFLWLPGNVFSAVCQNQTQPNWHILKSSERSLELQPKPLKCLSKLSSCSAPWAMKLLSHVLSQHSCNVPLQWDTNWSPAHHCQQKPWATDALQYLEIHLSHYYSQMQQSS